MRNPDFHCPFLVHTYISEMGLGAILSQEFDDEEHSIIYKSRKLTPAKQQYAAVE